MAKTITTPALAKALGHPTRLLILGSFSDETPVLSPSEIAAALDQPLGNISYHVRQLIDLGLLQLDRTTPVRGTVEHHYRIHTRALEAMEAIAAIAATYEREHRQPLTQDQVTAAKRKKRSKARRNLVKA